ncbi:hypothetical protein, partial [Streptomyces flavofungini]|uniref:hypothetical protein n=1 Tax=Streptomyces flavofungini TaxID=68200 RepID=UPI0034DE1B65
MLHGAADGDPGGGPRGAGLLGDGRRLGGGRHGYLHELRDQQASFRDVVQSVHTVRTASQIPSPIAAAWQSALTA